MFSIRDAEIIREVSRCGGFRAAAQKLRLSQSAVSTRVAETEQRLGVELFDRSRHGAHLTPTGRSFLDQAARMIDMRDQIISNLLPSSKFSGTIRIGVVESIVHTLLPNMLKKVKEAFPSARLELSVDLSSILAKRLVDNDIDLAIMLAPIVPAGTIKIPIFSCDLNWFAPCSISFPQRVLTPKDLVQFSIVTFLKDSLPYIEVERAFSDPRLPSPLLHGCASLSTIVHLVITGFGIGVIPAPLARRFVQNSRLIRLRTSSELNIRRLEFALAYFDSRNNPQMEQVKECAREAALEYSLEECVG